jgi:hypothetical protein
VEKVGDSSLPLLYPRRKWQCSDGCVGDRRIDLELGAEAKYKQSAYDAAMTRMNGPSTPQTPAPVDNPV